jgi:acyl-CoA synthetase (AMP-forming)/AMP-acid ligase II
MRLVAAVAAVAALLVTSAAKADRHMFIIANDADDYGVDRCLASNAACGRTVANAYCHSHEYAQAISFRKLERDDIAGAITTSGTERSCSGGGNGSGCGEFVAIECSR